MAQQVVSWFICNGRLKVYAVNAVGRHRGRIIELEDVDTGERLHDTPEQLLHLVDTLSTLTRAFGHTAEWIPERQ